MINSKSIISNKLFWLYALSAGVYAGQGIEDLPITPLFFYLKESLDYSESQIMYFMSLIGIAWLVKPIWGYISDNFKFSKKFWLTSSLTLSIILSFFIGIFSLPIFLLIGSLILINCNSAIRDVNCDGLMCCEGKKKGITGKIQSIQWIAITLMSILTGVGGGFIAEHFNFKISYLLLIPFYLILLFIVSKYKESPRQNIKKSSLFETLKKLFTDKNLIIVSLFIFLYNFAPSFGIPLTFIQRDTFGWSKQFIGNLATISAIMNVIGAVLYFKFSKKLNVKKSLISFVFIGALTTLAYIWYTPITAIVFECVNSTIGMWVQLLLLDFMARNTKFGLESTSFALLCSVTNLASTSDKLLGGWLFPLIGLQPLIILSALSSFLCLFLIKRINFNEKTT